MKSERICPSKVFFLLLMGFASGCATVQTARRFDGIRLDGDKTPIATIAVENYGYYLFGIYPLIGGDPKYPNAITCKIFEDTVTVQNNLQMLAKTARLRNGSSLAHVKTTINWTGTFSFWVVWKKLISSSAVALE